MLADLNPGLRRRAGMKRPVGTRSMPTQRFVLTDSSGFLRLRREFLQRKLLEPGSGPELLATGRAAAIELNGGRGLMAAGAFRVPMPDLRGDAAERFQDGGPQRMVRR